MTSTAELSDLADLRDAARSLLTARCDEPDVRATIEGPDGFDAALWKVLAGQLGAQSLTIPEEFGGDGYGYVELGVILSEMGRRIMPGPFFASVVLAGSAITLCTDQSAMRDYLPTIADGSRIATLAVNEQDGEWRSSGFTTRGRQDGTDWMLTGTKTLVPSAQVADTLIIAANTDSGPTLFAVDKGAPGMSIERLATLDLTRPLYTVRLHTVSARPVGDLGSASAVLDAVLPRATAALAAEQIGAARECLEMSVAYAKDRIQFGRAIGSFQAIKHKCADMFTAIELASAACDEALRAIDGLPDAPPAGVAAAVAHAACSEASMAVAKETIQVHGGIAFTWEHPAHLYFRRAKASQMMFGGPARYYERLLHEFGI
ncbi:MAG: acyl-CoA dehydrogenase family protein [Aeromicrobium sp.]